MLSLTRILSGNSNGVTHRQRQTKCQIHSSEHQTSHLSLEPWCEPLRRQLKVHTCGDARHEGTGKHGMTASEPTPR